MIKTDYEGSEWRLNRSWGDLLMEETVESLKHAFLAMGRSFAGRMRKEEMVELMVSHVTLYPEQVLEELEEVSLRLLRDLLRAGKGQGVAWPAGSMIPLLQLMLLVQTEGSGRHRRLFMVDELHDVFAPCLPVIVERLPPEEDFSQAVDWLEEEPMPEEAGMAGRVLPKPRHSLPRYTGADDLMEEVRRLDLDRRALACLAGCRALQATAWEDHRLVRTLEASLAAVCFEDVWVQPRLVKMAVNYLDNVMLLLDEVDAMVYAEAALAVEAVIFEYEP